MKIKYLSRVIISILLYTASATTVWSSDMDIIELSRSSTVEIHSVLGDSKGTGFFISEKYIITCFHVIGRVSNSGTSVTWSIYTDLKVTIDDGEILEAKVVSVPSDKDPDPLLYDFAVLELSKEPKHKHVTLQLAGQKEEIKVGDNVIFSGYPLATPGMVTHKGMLSGYDQNKSLLFIQASINKGNSGGALLSYGGKVLGIISMREGGISKGLNDLNKHIDATSAQGTVRLMGVDPLQSIKELIKTMDTYISTGIGYAISIRFLNTYLEKHPGILPKHDS